MKNTLLAIIFAFALILITALPAFAATSWKGTSTNLSGNFNYGPVSFKVQGRTIKDFKIEGVTTTGCGGYKPVIVPSIRITGSKFSATYRPLPGYNDVIRVNGRFSGSTATGTFSEGPLCLNAGKFAARRR